ncbi:MAG: winged helix-turn-helix domain-containing protein [Haloferacaceae archaeon]
MSVNELLPDRSPVDVETEPSIVNVDQADEVLNVLSSETARRILVTLYESPGPASEVAESTENSIQNVAYHLDRLEEAGLVEETGTWYSSKGKEMNVYAPTSAPLVVFAGDPTQEEAMEEVLDEHAAGGAPT